MVPTQMLATASETLTLTLALNMNLTLTLTLTLNLTLVLTVTNSIRRLGVEIFQKVDSRLRIGVTLTLTLTLTLILTLTPTLTLSLIFCLTLFQTINRFQYHQKPLTQTLQGRFVPACRSDPDHS